MCRKVNSFYSNQPVILLFVVELKFVVPFSPPHEKSSSAAQPVEV